MSLPSDATSSGVYSLHGSTRRSALSVNASPDFTVVRFDTDLDRSTWPQPARVKAHSRATAAVVTRRDTRCTVATPAQARAPNSSFRLVGHPDRAQPRPDREDPGEHEHAHAHPQVDVEPAGLHPVGVGLEADP